MLIVVKVKKKVIIKNWKKYFPIISTISSNEFGMKKDNNDTIGQYINNNKEKSDYTNENENNINKEKMNNKKIKDNNLNIINKKIEKNLIPNQSKVKPIEKEEEVKVKEEE